SARLGVWRSALASSGWARGCAIWASVGPLPEKFLTILGSPGTLASEHTPSTRRRSRRTPPTSEPTSTIYLEAHHRCRQGPELGLHRRVPDRTGCAAGRPGPVRGVGPGPG